MSHIYSADVLLAQQTEWESHKGIWILCDFTGSQLHFFVAFFFFFCITSKR